MSPEGGERQRFGRYETLFPIAAGGMAEVYAARALGEGGFQKVVALKRMRPELAEDARFVAMFLDEGRVAANIASPNVVSTLDLGRAADDSLYLVMELVTGTSLHGLMTETALRGELVPQPIAVDIIAQAAAGLHDAHEARSPSGEPLSIVHRDCSPHNVLIDVNGQVKITDFGIAKAMERQTQSQAGEMKGKLSYLSPEQARGLPVDRRADVFILGIVAWELLAGRQLFEADHPVEALYKVSMMPIPPLHEVRADVSEALSAVVAEALERDPEGRFSTAAAFGNALTNAMGGRTPPRAQIGAFVRTHGGRSLERLQQGIREALGKKGPDSVPPPSAEASLGVDLRAPRVPSELRPRSEPPAPPPLSQPPGPRPRSATRPMGSVPPPAVEVPESRFIDPRAPTDPDPELHPEATATRERLGPRGRARLETLPLPSEELPSAVPTPHRRSPLLTVALALVLLGAAGGAAALGAWWFDRRVPVESDVRTGTPPPDARSTSARPRAEPRVHEDAPPPTPELRTGTDLEPDSTEAAPIPPTSDATPAITEPTGRTRPRTRPSRIPSGTSSAPPTVTGTPPSPVGDRASTFDEIPWDPPRRPPSR